MATRSSPEPMNWNPDIYNRFSGARAQPFEDLFSLVRVEQNLQVIDLGCGTGDLTKRLAERLPGSEVLGIDSSLDMLERARGRERPNLQFRLESIESVQGEWDLVFSNAAIQWLEDHASLIPRLFTLVRMGGQLAIQIPDNHQAPGHRLIRETAEESIFSEPLHRWTRLAPNLRMEEYAQLLYRHCGEEFTIFAKIYPVVLPDADALLEWNQGTALLPYLQRLPFELHDAFLESYRQKLRRAYPDRPVFYPFRRMLFAGTRRR